MPTGPPSDRVRVRRHPERGVYERQVIDAIVDEALFCHVAWVAPDGPPRVIPTIHARVGDRLYIHGSEASRTLSGLRTGVECCVEITIVDGIVLARSTPKHSLNYRSVVVYGVAREVTDPDEKDMDLPGGAGVLPLGLVPGEPVPAANLQPGVEPPDYVTRYLRPER